MTNHETIELLNRSLAYVEKGWCQHANARDALGQGTTSDNEKAICWCASGACERAAKELDYPDGWFDVGRTLVAALGVTRVPHKGDVARPNVWGAVIDWNDDKDRTAEDVARLFRRAIQRLRETV